MKYSHISLLTDYGLQDEFVGVMKSVMIDMAPHVTITDITHGVAAFDIRSGSLTLARAIQYVPKGIVIAVVDPGVGTNRRAIAIEVADGDGILLGPDNGLLAPAVAMAGGAQRAFALTNTDLHLLAPGNTFAGRDIFAPVAAFLCNGGDLSEVGEEVDADLLVPGVVPLSQEETHDEYGAGLRCEITWIDSFGNCQLNVGIDDIAHLPTQLRVLVADDIRSMKVLANFAAIPTGGVGLVIDSYGMLALACDRESAASTLNVGTGDRVSLFAGDGDAGTTTSAVSLRSK